MLLPDISAPTGSAGKPSPSFGLAHSGTILLWFLGVCCFSIVEPYRGSEIIMAVAPKPRLSKPKGTRFVLRPYRRIPTWLVLYYLSGECVGKGVVTNLSQSGMRVQGDHAVEPGLDLALRLALADNGPTIEIERATVRWVDGYDFGLDLVRLSPLAAKHIAHVLSQQISSPQMPA